jgi:hypothetical protein
MAARLTPALAVELRHLAAQAADLAAPVELVPPDLPDNQDPTEMTVTTVSPDLTASQDQMRFPEALRQRSHVSTAPLDQQDLQETPDQRDHPETPVPQDNQGTHHRAVQPDHLDHPDLRVSPVSPAVPDNQELQDKSTKCPVPLALLVPPAHLDSQDKMVQKETTAKEVNPDLKVPPEMPDQMVHLAIPDSPDKKATMGKLATVADATTAHHHVPLQDTKHRAFLDAHLSLSPHTLCTFKANKFISNSS